MKIWYDIKKKFGDKYFYLCYEAMDSAYNNVEKEHRIKIIKSHGWKYRVEKNIWGNIKIWVRT